MTSEEGEEESLSLVIVLEKVFFSLGLIYYLLSLSPCVLFVGKKRIMNERRKIISCSDLKPRTHRSPTPGPMDASHVGRMGGGILLACAGL